MIASGFLNDEYVRGSVVWRSYEGKRMAVVMYPIWVQCNVCGGDMD